MTIELAVVPKKRGRGLGKKPALVCTSLRLPKEVVSFYETFGKGMQAKMREVLADFVKQHEGVSDDQTNK